jgi:hypothetical protein
MAKAKINKSGDVWRRAGDRSIPKEAYDALPDFECLHCHRLKSEHTRLELADCFRALPRTVVPRWKVFLYSLWRWILHPLNVRLRIGE